jgi:hypothetical protein
LAHVDIDGPSVFPLSERPAVLDRVRGIAEAARTLFEEGERLGVWSPLDAP